MQKLTKDYRIHFTLIGLIVFLMAIVTFVFNASGWVNQVNANKEDITEIRSETKKIPILETQMDFVVRGMEALTNTKFK